MDIVIQDVFKGLDLENLIMINEKMIRREFAIISKIYGVVYEKCMNSSNNLIILRIIRLMNAILENFSNLFIFNSLLNVIFFLLACSSPDSAIYNAQRRLGNSFSRISEVQALEQPFSRK